MAKIKGITIELGGDASGLENAINDVESKIRETRKELNDVNRLLRFNPDNTDLLKQKQTLLNNAINDTEEELKGLKEAYRIAQEQAESGDLGEKELRKMERAVIEADSKLGNLKDQLKKTDKALVTSESSFAKFTAKAKDAGGKLSGLSSKATVLVGALAGTVPATQEMRRDLSNLEQNAKQTGVGMKKTTEAFKTFNAVSGETDSAVEATSNLLQAGFTESNLQKAVEGLSGAYQRFPDTLKIESLADSLQETLATGKATGQFGELLDRLGIGADKFSAGLAKCKTEAEKQNYALEFLEKNGLNGTYEEWKKNNSELADYENAMFDVQQALTELGTTISPIVSKVIELASRMLEWFNSLPTAVQGAIGGIVLFVAALSPVLKIIGNLQSLPNLFMKIGTVVSSISAPILIVAGVIASLIAVFAILWKTNENFRTTVQNGWKMIMNTIAIVVAEIKAILKAFGEMFSAFWDEWGGMITSIVKNAMNIIKAVITAGLNILKNIFQLFGNIIKGNWKGVFKNLLNIAKSIFSLIGTVIKNAFFAIVAVIGGFGSKILKSITRAFASGLAYIKNLKKKAVEWGKDFIGGLIDGIKAKATALVDSVKGLAKKIASFLHFSRPDEGPLHYYESWMPDFMKGLAEGIKNNEYLVTDEIQSLAGKMNVEQATLTSSVNTNFDYSLLNSIVKNAVTNMDLKILLNNRELGRAVRGVKNA